jgi:glucan biosynthesis protein C
MAMDATKDRRESRRRGALPSPVQADRDDRSSGPCKPRYHAFDALRGIAMFLVVGLHSALGYIEKDIPGVLWCVRDAPTSPVFDWFCWWSMGVSNPLYFTIAGFFAVSLYDSRGLRKFLENRARRVAIPFLVAVVTVLPACLLAWMYGWLISGRCTWRQAVRLRFRDPAIQAERFGTAHLWFLEYLIVMLLAYAIFRWWTERRRGGQASLHRFASLVLGSRWRPFLLAVPTTALLWISRERVGIDAALDRHNSFLIDPIKLAHHASFFVVGLGLFRLKDDLDRLARAAPWYLAVSVPVFAGRAWLLGRDWVSPLHGAPALALAVLGALFSWLVVFGGIGAAHRLFRRDNPALSYLADSSYWIYLVHMPILGLIQGDLYLVPGHAVWKMPVTLTGTLVLGLASYHSLVRYTALGAGLHGPRLRAAFPPRERELPSSEADRRRDAGAVAVGEPSRWLRDTVRGRRSKIVRDSSL